MPVRIIRRSEERAKAAALAAAAKTEEVAPTPAVEVTFASIADAEFSHVKESARGWEIGDGLILHKVDLFPEEGKVKFLLNRVNKGVWYRLRDYEEVAKLLSLTSQTSFNFDARVDVTLYHNYVVAIYPEGTVSPTEDMLAFVNRRLPPVQS